LSVARLRKKIGKAFVLQFERSGRIGLRAQRANLLTQPARGLMLHHQRCGYGCNGNSSDEAEFELGQAHQLEEGEGGPAACRGTGEGSAAYAGRQSRRRRGNGVGGKGGSKGGNGKGDTPFFKQSAQLFQSASDAFLRRVFIAAQRLADRAEITLL